MKKDKGPLGPKIGWIGGMLGAALWMPLLAVGFAFKGDVLPALVGGLCFCLALVATLMFRPWKHPNTHFWRLYVGAIAPMIFAAVFFVMYYRKSFIAEGTSPYVSILVIVPALLPAFLHGKKTWKEFIGEE